MLTRQAACKTFKLQSNLCLPTRLFPKCVGFHSDLFLPTMLFLKPLNLHSLIFAYWPVCKTFRFSLKPVLWWNFLDYQAVCNTFKFLSNSTSHTGCIIFQPSFWPSVSSKSVFVYKAICIALGYNSNLFSIQICFWFILFFIHSCFFYLTFRKMLDLHSEFRLAGSLQNALDFYSDLFLSDMHFTKPLASHPNLAYQVHSFKNVTVFIGICFCCLPASLQNLYVIQICSSIRFFNKTYIQLPLHSAPPLLEWWHSLS